MIKTIIQENGYNVAIVKCSEALDGVRTQIVKDLMSARWEAAARKMDALMLIQKEE